jgi:hypothetical protein
MTAIAVPAAVAAAIRADRVARTPAAVVVPIGFVISTDVTHSDAAVDTNAIHGTTCQGRHA